MFDECIFYALPLIGIIAIAGHLVVSQEAGIGAFAFFFPP